MYFTVFGYKWTDPYWMNQETCWHFASNYLPEEKFEVFCVKEDLERLQAIRKALD